MRQPLDTRAATVVLVHGLGMHGVVMGPLRRRLARSGYDAVSYSYPTLRLTLTENAARLADFAHARNASALHWFGHSLGGLVILRMLQCVASLPAARVVLAGTPCCGSSVASALERNALGTHILGRSMREWLYSDWPDSFPGHDIGVIAGTLRLGLGSIIAPGLPIPNDGVVTVKETEMPAACDHIALPVSHTGMLISRAVARQTGAFLRDGRFDHAS